MVFINKASYRSKLTRLILCAFTHTHIHIYIPGRKWKIERVHSMCLRYPQGSLNMCVCVCKGVYSVEVEGIYTCTLVCPLTPIFEKEESRNNIFGRRKYILFTPLVFNKWWNHMLQKYQELYHFPSLLAYCEELYSLSYFPTWYETIYAN